MPTPVPINISPSTSVILVSVSDYSTLNQTPVVQLSTVGTIGRLVTIRDNDGLASLDYPIIISTTRSIFFQEQIADYPFSSLKITQPFGSATVTLRDSADAYKWGLVNTFGFPNVQDAVNVGVTNTHLINASTMLITESITNEGTSVFNDQVVIDSSDLITDAIYTSTIDVEVNANMQSLSSIHATIDNQSTINMATQDLYADYGEITEGIFSTVYATDNITTDESFIGYRLSTTQATIDDISAVTMYVDNGEFSSLYTTYEAVFDCEIEANSTIYAEDLQASTLYLIDSRNNLPQLITVSSGFVKLNDGDIYVIPRLISTRSLYLSSLYLSTIGLTDKTLLTNSQLYTQNNEIFLNNLKVLYNTSNYSSVQYITSTLNSSTITNSNLLTTGFLSTLSNAAIGQTLQTGNFSTLSNASIVQTLNVGNISTNSNIYAANNILASNTLSSAITNTNQLYASSLAINRPGLQNRYNADISGSLFVPSTFTSSLITQQLSTNSIVARDFVSTNSLTTSTLVAQGYSAFGTNADTAYRVNINPVSTNAININGGFVDNALIRASDGSPGGIAGVPAYGFAGLSGLGMYRPSLTTSLAFATNSTERIRITETGNVGIRTVSPAYTLDVNGSSRMQSISTNSISTNSIVASTFTGSNITLSNILITSSVNANNLSTNFIQTSALSTNNIIVRDFISTNSLTTSTFVSQGYSAFGTNANTTYRVNVNPMAGASSGAINVNNGFLDNAINRANDGTAAMPGYTFSATNGNIGIFRPSGSGSLAFATSSTERMRVSASGLVGINNSTPAYLLDVNGASRIQSISTISISTNSIVTSGLSTANIAVSSILTTSTVNANFIQTSNFSTINATTSNLNVSSIGVNCNAPRFALDINGNLNVAGNTTFSSVTTGYINNAIILTSSLGINTNNPRYALDVAGEAAISSLLVTSNASIQGDLQTQNVSSIGSTYISNNLLVGTSNLFVSSGLVGINTLTPSTTLDVNGTFRTINENRGFVHLSNAQSQLGNGFFTFHDNLAYTQSSFGFVQISRSNTSNANRHALAFTQGTTGFGTTANVVGAGFLAASQTFGLMRGVSSINTSHNGIFMDSASRVGINLNNPNTSFNLDISGSTRINAIGLGLQLNGNNNSTFMDILPSGNPSCNTRIGFVNSNFSIANNYGTDIVLCNNSAETARFTNSNRLGINCNAPQFRVDIGGNLRTTEYVSTPNMYTSNVYFLDSSGNNNVLNSQPGGLYYNGNLVAGSGGGGGSGIASIPLNLSTNNILVSTISSQQIFTSTINIASTLTANGLSIFNNQPLLRRWVAGGLGGSNLEYSDDGINWNNGTSNFTDVRAIIYDGSKYIAGGIQGAGGSIATSSDGITWTTLSGIPSNTGCYALATSGSDYLAGCYGTNTILRSSNGSTWTAVANSTLLFSTTCSGFATDGRMWVLVGSGTTNTIAYGYIKGTSFFGLGKSIFSTAGYAIAWNGVMWVAGGAGTNTLAYSYNGTTWTAVPGSTSIFSSSVLSISWNGTLWVAGGQGTNTIAYSYDGINWVAVSGSTSIFSLRCRRIAWNGVMWVAVGEGGNTHAYSYNGITWIAGGSGKLINGGYTVAYSSNLSPDVQYNNLNMYTQGIPNYIASTNQIMTTSTTIILNNTLCANYGNDTVGINNFFPSTALDVTGSLRVTQNGFISSLATNSISTNNIVASNYQSLSISTGTIATSSITTSSMTTTLTTSVRTSTLALNVSSIALGVTNAITPLHIASGTQYSTLYVSYDASSGNNLLSADGLRIGMGRVTNGSTMISLVGDTANPTFGLQLMRCNADSYITHAGATGNLQINASNSANIHFLTANVERMRILSSGTVGINCNAPNSNYKLDVNGNVNVHGMVNFRNTQLQQVRLFAPFENDFQFSGFGIGTGQVRYSVWGTSDDHVFAAGNGSGTSVNELLRIKGTGNVGIGLSNPSFRLDVSGGSLRVASNALLSSVQTNYISTSFMNMSTLNANYVSTPTISASNVSTTNVYASSLFATYGQISTISTTTMRGQTVNTNSLNATLLSTTQLNTSSISATTVYANIITGTIISAPTVLTTTLSLNNFTVQNLSTTGVATLVNSSNTTNIYVTGGQTQAGSNASIVYSSDGITWTNSTNGYTIFNNTVYSIIYDGNNFLAAGQGTSGNAFAYSADGNTWTGLGTLGGLFSIGNDLAYNGRRYIALGQGTNTIAFNDSNAISGTWTGLGTSIFSSSGNVVLWTGLRFVAVGTGTTNSIAYSDTGASWIGVTGSKTLFSGQGNSLAYNGVLLIAVGEGTNTMATSRDGITWTALSTSPFTTAGYDVTWNGEIWVAVGAGTNTLAYSSDGRTWTGVSGIFTTAGRNVIWNGIQFIATGQGTNTYATSRNGINWTGRGTSWLSAGYASAYSSNVGPDVVLSNLNIYSRANPIYNTSTNTIFASQNAIILNDTLSVNRSTNSVQIYGSFNADTIPNMNGATINASSITLNNVLRASTISANTLSTNSISTLFFGASNISISDVVRVPALSTITLSTNIVNAAQFNASSMILTEVARVPAFSTITLSTNIVNAAQFNASSMILTEVLRVPNFSTITLSTNVVNAAQYNASSMILTEVARVPTLNTTTISTNVINAAQYNASSMILTEVARVPTLNATTISTNIVNGAVLNTSTFNANTVSTNSISTLFFGASNISISDVARILAISTTTISTNVINAAQLNASSINLTTNAITPSLSSINISTNVVSHGQGTRLAPSMTFGAYSNTGIYSAFSNTINFVTGGANNPTSQIQLFDRMIISSIDKGVMFPINRIRFPEGANSKRKIVLHGRDDPSITETDDMVTAIGRDSDGYMTFQADSYNAGFKFANYNQSGNGSVEVMRIVGGASLPSDGKVEIGTNNPLATLHVVGNSIMNNLSNITSFTSSINASSITLSNTLAVGYGSASAPTYTFSTNTNTGFFCPSTNLVALTTNGSERLRVLQNGYVGIGTANPTTTLHVVSGANQGILSSNSVGDARITIMPATGSFGTEFKRVDGTNGEFVVNNYGTGPIILNPGNTTTYASSLTITSPGNVGIGMTDPTERLDVDGAIAIRGGTVNRAGPTSNAYIYFGSNGATTDWVVLRQIGGANQLTLSYDFFDDVADTRFVLRNNPSATGGNPWEVLRVDNDSTGTGTNGTLQVSQFSNATPTQVPALSLRNVTTGGSPANTHQLNFYPNARTGDYNGIVQSNDKSIIFTNGGQGTGNFVLAPWANTGVTSGLRMNSSGQIAINTSTPTSLVMIAQNSANSTRAISGQRWGENNNPSQIMLTGATNTNKRLAVGYNTIDDAGAIQALDFTAGLKPLLLNPAGGSVGVNRTDANYTMDISGSLRATGDFLAGGTGNLGGTCFLGPYNTRTQIGSDGNAYIIIGRGRTDTTNSSYLDFQVQGGGNFTDTRFIRTTGVNGDFYMTNYGTGNIIIEANNAARMVVNGNGRVGIATTSPLTTFHTRFNNTNGNITLADNLPTAEDTSAKTLLQSCTGNAVAGPYPFVNGVRFNAKIGSTYYAAQLSGTAYFTGQHKNFSEDSNINSKDHEGLIVVSSGKYKSYEHYVNSQDPIKLNNIDINESLPIINLSSMPKQKSVFGVITTYDNECPPINNNQIVYDYETSDYERSLHGRLRINSVGEGAIWVTNINGNFQNGDYITTCAIPGYGALQDDDLLHNYTVAKITCDCDFDNLPSWIKTRNVTHNGQTYKAAFVGCTYHCG